MKLTDFEMEIFPDIKEVTISGSISVFFHGLTIDGSAKANALDHLVGLPIKSEMDGEVVGKITEVDVDNDIWHGVMFIKEKLSER